MSTTPAIRDPQDLPALYQGANEQSLDAQRSFLMWSKLRLCSIVVAALGGAIGLTAGDFHVGGAIAFVAFAVVIAAELVLAIGRPDRIWYQGRTAAESAKTLSWRYMVRGEPFETDARDADEKLLAELDNVLHDLNNLPVQARPGDVQISEKMRQIRALAFKERRMVYLHERIQDQQGWYAGKAARNHTQANRWIVATIVLEFFGLIGGAVKAAGLIDVDLLGIFATAAAAAAAWLQAKQYQNLATAYGVTSQELASLASRVETLADEAMWAQFVDAAEEAISREHTLWRASLGIPVRPRRP